LKQQNFFYHQTLLALLGSSLDDEGRIIMVMKVLVGCVSKICMRRGNSGFQSMCGIEKGWVFEELL